MDREIPIKEQKRKRRMRWIRYGGAAVAVIAVTAILYSLSGGSVQEKELIFSKADRGTIEVSVSASGKIVPAMEEIINSPINTRVIEVYKRGGDSVNVGTPIMMLDLQSAETDYQKMRDQQQIKQYELKQLSMDNETYLNRLSMQVKVSEMKLNRMAVELKNEVYLDSLGSGTTEKVHEAALAYETEKLELQQLRQQYVNERAAKAADIRVKELEMGIASKNIAETARTLEEAKIRSPRKGILTYINSEIGAQIPQNSRVAVVSDLDHFKVDAEISDNYSDRLSAGAKAIVKIGSLQLEGVVSSVTPLSRNGIISFTVQILKDNHPKLRSGLKADVYVIHAVKDEVIRIKNGSYYSGAGSYELFVKTGSRELRKRTVRLGDSSFDYVEVIDGIRAGEEVVVGDMSRYTNRNTLKLK